MESFLESLMRRFKARLARRSPSYCKNNTAIYKDSRFLYSEKMYNSKCLVDNCYHMC